MQTVASANVSRLHLQELCQWMTLESLDLLLSSIFKLNCTEAKQHMPKKKFLKDLLVTTLS